MADSSETESEEETRCLDLGIDSFRDLLKGNIDIIEYLNSEPGSAALTDNVLDEDHRLINSKIMDGSVNMNGQNHNLPLLHPGVQNMRQPPIFRPQGRLQPYEQAVRLPDSPPETDSGAGSAGSPSGSETSPYSPEFQHFHHPGHMQGSVIHPPVVGGPASHNQQPGVILNVHGLDNLTQTIVNDYILPVQANGRVHNNGHMSAHMNASPDFYPTQPTPGAQQSSPNGNYTPYVLPPPSVNSLSNDGSLSRKRPRTDNSQFVKPEPSMPSPIGGGIGNANNASNLGGGSIQGGSEESLFFEDGLSHQTIRFFEFQKEQWHGLCDISGRELSPLGFHVVADKGFNFSHFDTAFVNQKKNHFQISVHIEVRNSSPPKFVKIPGDNGGLRPISEFQLDFYGVKAEMLSSSVLIKQSQTDRKPIGYEPVKLDLPANRVTKVTVARLHFSETTMNNQRKNGRPNPDQKFFFLVAALNAVVQGNERYTVVAFSSEKVIVRASNPGQFDNGDNEVHWQKGQTSNSIYHPGPIGIGTDKPTSTLTVAGDIQCTGNFFHPSDARLKQNIIEVNCADALTRLSQIRIVRYEIRPEIAEEWGLSEEERNKVGVIAQELEEIIPDAVRDDGEFLTVDDSRIFYESAAAVKELCRLTGNLEYKISEVEKISEKLSKLNKLKRLDSLRSSATSMCSSKAASVCASYISCSRTSLGSTPPTTRRNETKDSNNNGKEKEKCSKSSRHHHHHHHHHMCRRLRTDGSLCSNKAIQTTIIVLVIVMAFCLLAMATLYILDWHKRNSAGLTVNEIYSQQQDTGGSTNDRAVQPPSIPSPHGTKKPHDPGEMSVLKTGSPPPTKPMRKLPGLPPMVNPCVKLPCESFCCNDPSPFISYSYRSSDDKNESGIQNIIIVDKKKPSPIGSKFRRQVKLAVTNESSGEISKNTLNARYHYNVEHPISAPVKIRILGNIDVAVDDRYCYDDLCKKPNHGNFTYYVPVSSAMPHIPLEVQFTIGDEEQLQFCGKATGQLCYGLDRSYNDGNHNPAPDGSSSIGNVHKRRTDVWELPVGNFFESSYKFRVGPSTTLCSLPKDEVGATFIEYTLWFYRLCA